MGKSKSSLLSSLTDIFSTADLREKRAAKKKSDKDERDLSDIMGSGSDITFGTILEEDYQAAHAEEDRRADKGSERATKKKKKKPNKLMATLSDIFSTVDIDDGAPNKPEGKSRRWRKGKKEENGRLVKDVDANTNLSTETLLELERNRRIQAEAQIQTILEMNRSMEAQGAGSEDSGILTLHRQLLSLKLKLNREEKRRLEAEKREYDAHADLEMCHSALHGAQQEKIQLEAELMEAAADVLEQQALQSACREIQKTCQDALKREKEALDAAEKHREDMLIQQERLRVSEEEKGRLVEDIARLKIESTRWEEALDRLQDQVDMVLLHDNAALRSQPYPDPKETGATEQEISSGSERSVDESCLWRNKDSIGSIKYED